MTASISSFMAHDGGGGRGRHAFLAAVSIANDSLVCDLRCFDIPIENLRCSPSCETLNDIQIAFEIYLS